MISLRAFVTGVVGVIVTLTGLRAEADPARAHGVVVLDGTKLPDQIADAHERLRTAIEAAVRASGWVPVAAAATPADCDGTPACYRAAAGTSSVAVVIRVTGERNINDGYDLEAQMWRASDGATKRIVGSCSFCVVEDMTRIARKLVRDLLVDADKPPAPAAPAPAPAPEALKVPPLVLPQPSVEPATPPQARLTAPIVVGAAGVAVLAAGVTLWILDGRSNGNCHVPLGGSSFCGAYATGTIGQVLTGVGAVALGVSGLLFWRAEEDARATHVAIGPGSVSLMGRF